MQIRKIIQRRIRRRGNGVDFVGDVNAVIAANVADPSDRPRSRSDNSETQARAKEERDDRRRRERSES
jgi:hypothetical protein